MLEKANMLLLTKEATDKDRSLNTQLVMATDSQKKNGKRRGKAIWKNFNYFGDEKTDFNIKKECFPEKALCYVNQDYLLTVKNDELAICNNNFIISQLLVAANQPENID